MKIVPLTVLVLVMSALGCTDKETSAKPSCDAIMEACHPVDPGNGPIHECHEQSESATEAACQGILASCTAICVAGDAGADAAVTTDAATDHGH